MKIITLLVAGSLIIGLTAALTIIAYAQPPHPAAPPANFKSAVKQVNGIRIHYVIGGTGTPLVLVHGFGNNWYMWNRLLPELSKHFTVIAPDLPGVGESDKPAGGYDKKTMAADIHALVRSLGYHQIDLVGHDIGLMVVYAYAAQFPDEVKKLVLMDALIPGVDPSWTENTAKAWWWGFFGWGPSAGLVEGRERYFLENFWPTVGYVKDAFTPAEKQEFIRAYAVHGAIAAAFQWFRNFGQDAADNKVLMKKKLQMPLLALGGDHANGPLMQGMARTVADHVSYVQINGAGHWLVQEQPKQVLDALLHFL